MFYNLDLGALIIYEFLEIEGMLIFQINYDFVHDEVFWGVDWEILF